MQAGLLNKGIDRGAGRPSKDRATVERGERSQVIALRSVPRLTVFCSLL